MVANLIRRYKIQGISTGRINMENQTSKFKLFLTIFIVGALSGLTLTVLSTWADLEAANYGFARRAGAGLRGLSCPVLMTSGEADTITLKVTNSTEQKRSPAIRTEISSPTTAFLFTDFVELQPGESTIQQWEIGPDNVDLKHFIFAKVLVYSFYPNPDREGTCGVYILGLPGRGVFYTWGMVALSLLGMGIGLYGLKQTQSPERSGTDIARQLMFMAAVVVLGLVTVYMGSWVQGILILVIILLFAVIASGLMVNRANK